ncbi:MAG: carbohydrate ABC transporter permease [Defluviitaleaceae bacterium]|nr:carbohydrate ABC transporter permease [Defluviitaleaceae bacterium]MCL2275888.1 carbohydrate ABC transporter permease [Defluviitaleaceae bacterium]
MVGKHKASDYVIDGVIILVMLIVLVVVMYPLLNALAISLNHADDTARGGIGIWPREFAWESYRNVVNNTITWRAYGVTVARTVIGTVTALFSTGIIAYGMAHSNLVGRKFYAIFCLIPMYFVGGLIPMFLLIRAMGLFNNFWVYIIPTQIGLFNIILMRTFFQTLPESLEESAQLDGANYLTIFFKIIIPISTPIIATIALFIGVFHWNDWFFGNVYITNPALRPMQNVLMGLVEEARFAEMMAAIAGQGGGGMGAALAAAGRGRPTSVRSIQMATMFITIIPVIIVYPFLQRYFIKGIMVGSVKG